MRKLSLLFVSYKIDIPYTITIYKILVFEIARPAKVFIPLENDAACFLKVLDHGSVNVKEILYCTGTYEISDDLSNIVHIMIEK